ncbi:hypothetical protein [Candidatus Symbiothrix dinenymphae]|uniref:hypothetical protein n=1 Tax=Candidatus Symbiothrix dinenymphae TaxID=467085 RepID=UPI000B29B62E|nr:hypothetical protein [Candidatus Symbiothrix dinenymphae]
MVTLVLVSILIYNRTAKLLILIAVGVTVIHNGGNPPEAANPTRRANKAARAAHQPECRVS